MPFDPSKPPVIFGEALCDCFPDGTQVLGGAPFNVAWYLAAFGAAPVFVSSVGGDALGNQIERAMADRGMSRLGLQRNPFHGTGTVQVTLSEGEPSYDIVDRTYTVLNEIQDRQVNTPTSLFDSYIGLQRALETFLNRDVDLVMPAAIENPYLRASIDQSRKLMHGA